MHSTGFKFKEVQKGLKNSLFIPSLLNKPTLKSFITFQKTFTYIQVNKSPIYNQWELGV